MAAVTGFRVLARDRMAPDQHVQRGEDEVQDRILDWDHSEGVASTGRGDPGRAMGKKPRQDSSAVMCVACSREAQPVVQGQVWCHGSSDKTRSVTPIFCALTITWG